MKVKPPLHKWLDFREIVLRKVKDRGIALPESTLYSYKKVFQMNDPTVRWQAERIKELEEKNRKLLAIAPCQDIPHMECKYLPVQDQCWVCKLCLGHEVIK